MIATSRNYFHEYHDTWLSPSTQYIETDFVNKLSFFLHDQYVMKPNRAIAISTALFSSMSDMDLYYHTPLHIMSMLAWAQENDITLSPPVELALWFHDAIYDPRAKQGDNEEQSQQFMRSLLKPYVSAKELAQVGFMIEMTGEHFTPHQLSADTNLLLDLDLCNFAWDHKNYTASAQAIELEFSFHGKDAVRQGRRKFLVELNDKENIYRSKFIHNKFEARARANIQRTINRLADQLKVASD